MRATILLSLIGTFLLGFVVLIKLNIVTLELVDTRLYVAAFFVTLLSVGLGFLLTNLYL